MSDRKCEKCTATIPSGETRCPFCGTIGVNSQEVPSSMYTASARSNKRIAPIVAFVIVFAAVCGAYAAVDSIGKKTATIEFEILNTEDYGQSYSMYWGEYGFENVTSGYLNVDYYAYGTINYTWKGDQNSIMIVVYGQYSLDAETIYIVDGGTYFVRLYI